MVEQIDDDLRDREETSMREAVLISLSNSGDRSISDIQVETLTLDMIRQYIYSIPEDPDVEFDFKNPIIHHTAVNPKDKEVYNYLFQISTTDTPSNSPVRPISVYFVSTEQALSMIVPIQLNEEIVNVHIRNVGEDRTPFIQQLYERAEKRKAVDLKLVKLKK